MVIKTNITRNKALKRLLEHSLYLSILFVAIPSFLFFEIAVVLPAIIEPWTIAYIIHMLNAAFLLVNIVSNMIYGMLTESSISKKHLDCVNNNPDWSFCSVCESLRPPRSWHCDTCHICILKRDHHCSYFACCIGYYNHRYFMFFVFYIFVTMVYAFYYNIIFLSLSLNWNRGMVMLKFLFPLACLVVDFNEETIYIFLIVMNVLIGFFTGFLFFYHLQNVLNGKTTPERKLRQISQYKKCWRSNLIEVFGLRWYLTWLSPFVKSPLPGDGTQWEQSKKCN